MVKLKVSLKKIVATNLAAALRPYVTMYAIASVFTLQ